MSCDRFWAVAAKRAHLATLVLVAGGGKAALDSGLCGLGQISYGLGVLCVEGWGCPCAMFVLRLLAYLYI